MSSSVPGGAALVAPQHVQPDDPPQGDDSGVSSTFNITKPKVPDTVTGVPDANALLSGSGPPGGGASVYMYRTMHEHSHQSTPARDHHHACIDHCDHIYLAETRPLAAGTHPDPRDVAPVAHSSLHYHLHAPVATPGLVSRSLVSRRTLRSDGSPALVGLRAV